jgi:hypothetical protein
MNTDINCFISNTVQSVDLVLYHFFCGSNQESAAADIIEGDKTSVRHEKVIRALNASFGTEYDINSVVITDCPRADYGICVMTPNPGSLIYTLDIFRPFDRTRYQYMIAGHCLTDSVYNPLNPASLTDEEPQNCDNPYEGPAYPLINGDVISTMRQIEELRAFSHISDAFSGIKDFFSVMLTVFALWFGIDIRTSDEMASAAVAPRYPADGFPAGGGDGGSLLEPRTVNSKAVNEKQREAPIQPPASRPVTTRYPMEIFAGRCDGMTAGR